MNTACRYILYLTFPLATLAVVTNVKAQSITPDTTLGNENSVVTPNVDLGKGIPTDRIDGGATRGNNLFHSFSNFNVDAGRGAYFSNPTGIENIISRVTGSDVSKILGTLGVLGNANLFFANPNGIVFGPNARLDVSGSFFATTSDSFTFDNGFEFSASNPQAPPLLTVNIPIGLRFRDNPESITNQSVAVDANNNPVGLQFLSGKTLALVGGDVKFEGGTVTAPGAKVEIGGLSTEGIVGINDDLSLSFPEGVTRGDVSLINGGIINVTAGDGGFLTVNARNLEVREGSQLLAGIGSGLGTPQAQAGDIIINATDNVLFDNSFAVNAVNSNGVGNAGDISVSTGSFQLLNGGIFSASTLGEGNSGKVNITARDTVSLDNSFIVSNVLDGAFGKSGGIDINTGSLSFANSAQIQSIVVGQGDSGKVNINARDNIFFDNSSIFSYVFPNAVGNSGEIDITAGSLFFTNGTRIQSIVFGQGKSGNINFQVDSFKATNDTRITVGTAGQGDGGDLFIKATELVEVLGTEEPGKSSNISASVLPGGTGDAGDFTIETKKLVIRNSQVGNSTFGKGNAGNLTVKASESVDIIGKVFSENTDNPTQPIRNPSGLFSQVNTSGEGNSGNLTVETPRLSVGNGGKIQVAVFGKGNAGNLFIRAADIDIYDTPGKADFFQGGIFAGFQVDEDETEVPPSGDFGGTVTIETDRLRVRDGGAVTVFTEGDGNAGILKINAKEFIEVYGEVNTATTNDIFTSKISAEATPESTGNSGTVTLNTNKLIVRDSGKITAENLGQGKEAGNIDIQVGELLLLRRGGTISTNSAQDTDGGNININTGVLVAFPNENSDITSNAVRGTGGRIDIKALGIFGIEPRDALTDLSDITANSEFGVSGTVTINNPEIDPNSGLIELPETVVDAKKQIAQNACQQGVGSELVATGRGGLPPSPTQDSTSSAVRVGLATPVVSNATNTIASKPKPTPTVKKIVPVQGWVFNSKGQVVLTAYNPNQIGVRRTAHNALCKEK
ncbi:MAG: filamentous hemagglutinin N-terminal domain-containing protein [Calothrix sp. MO_167.B42]|nr:filamentous hemagglutinin N-terminal domain-containing protein [Calothrix sp. MO_167.B42]